VLTLTCIVPWTFSRHRRGCGTVSNLCLSLNQIFIGHLLPLQQSHQLQPLLGVGFGEGGFDIVRIHAVKSACVVKIAAGSVSTAIPSDLVHEGLTVGQLALHGQGLLIDHSPFQNLFPEGQFFL